MGPSPPHHSQEAHLIPSTTYHPHNFPTQPLTSALSLAIAPLSCQKCDAPSTTTPSNPGLRALDASLIPSAHRPNRLALVNASSVPKIAKVGYLRSGSGLSLLLLPSPPPSTSPPPPPEENPSLRPAAAKYEDADDNTGTAGNPGNDVASPGAMARDVGGSSGEMSRLRLV
ncbi:Cation-transporting ATPase 4 [Lasiodiplodia theobromae]|uniref:Cation-transporting ATPase 4 n=1 Tax=Lasiodiplodia theobromae TaxID=45133 RepID=UPI0015C32BD5|nr:Cation-transporting ATPase 4 [Lasiodiplodia theobromae]KAF4540761.1 Cation-transporting ATPase 4 [Lasiodiplodia theobromae]